MAAPLEPAGEEHGFVTANGCRFHYVAAGRGPLVLLLHGFPEFSYGWRRQLPALAAAGFRAVAPDLRGYHLTERPGGVGSYALETLVRDVSQLVVALGERSAALVGHDWGGVLAWYAAMHHPTRVRRLAILNAPHPATYQREIRRLSSQVVRSWYALFFQLPLVPEIALRAFDHAAVRSALRAGPAPSEEEMERYIEALSAPGALTAALNYYRAALRHPRPACVRIDVPTLLLWGERDRYLVPQLTEGLEDWVSRLTVVRLPDASHWLHHEEPDAVSERLVDFLLRQRLLRQNRLTPAGGSSSRRSGGGCTRA